MLPERDEQLILAIARGGRDYGEIAESFGLSEAEVAAISRGEHRPELKASIDATARSFLVEAQRFANRAAVFAMAALWNLTKAQTEEVAAETRRKAAVDLLKYAFGDSESPANRTGSPAAPGLTQEDLEQLAEMKQGPRG